MKRKLPLKFLALAITALALAGVAPNAMAFCISNSSLSHNKIIASQLSKTQIQTIENFKQCLVHNGYSRAKDSAQNSIYQRCSTNHKMPQYFRNAARELAGRGTFAKSVGPDRTECCSWKNKGCNPVGLKKSPIVLVVKSFDGTSHMGGKRIYEDPDRFFEHIFTIGANDHLECRTFKTNKRGTGTPHECRNYVWPQTPFRAHEKTRHGMLIKSKDTGKCLEVGGWNKKNGANVNMWKCTGGKNQRWVVYRNGAISSEMNNKCLDVAVRNVRSVKNGSNVVVSDCHGARNQRWTSGRDDQIISRVPGKQNWCMEVGGWNKKNGANVNIWKCGKAPANQIWQIVKK